MTLKASTGLRNAMLASLGLTEALGNVLILIYSGPVPASADAAVTGTLLTTISDNSTGAPLAFDAPSGGTLPKAAAQVWSGINVASGTATHFRAINSATPDDGTLSTTQVRLQGTCGTAGADLNMSSVNLSAGATQTIDACNITLPTF
ncbi:hypothetical protein ABL850_15560 [Variovorax paradoxus]|uniref:hypothetical protein n=1 Tax=Variovorax paradoxus TaxID=34073 RepID=UPI0003F7A9A2